MALSKEERERRERNAQELEAFKVLYQEFETLALPTLKGSPSQIKEGEAARERYIAMLKKGYQNTMQNAVKNGIGFQAESIQKNIQLLKTRTTAGRW